MGALKDFLEPQPGLFDERPPVELRRPVPRAVGAEILAELGEKLADKPRPKKAPPVAGHVLLVDGRALLDSGYHATKNEEPGRGGVPIGGVPVYAKGLFDIIDRVQPTHVFVAFDHPNGADDRKRMLKEYKSKRPEKPLEHLAQIDAAKRLTTLLGIALACPSTGEADDAIATVVRRCPEDAEITVFSSDKDLLQLLVRPRLRILWRRRGEWHETEGAAGALARLGVRPEQVSDYLGLVGDASDDVPGCPGIGEVTAQKLLAAHRSLRGIESAFGALKVPSAARVERLLRAGWAYALLSRSVVILRSDIEDQHLPRDGWDVQDELRWTPGRVDVDGILKLRQELMLPRLAREFLPEPAPPVDDREPPPR